MIANERVFVQDLEHQREMHSLAKFLFSIIQTFVTVTAIQYIVITVLLAILQPAFIMTMYYDLRTRKEYSQYSK